MLFLTSVQFIQILIAQCAVIVFTDVVQFLYTARFYKNLFCLKAHLGFIQPKSMFLSWAELRCITGSVLRSWVENVIVWCLVEEVQRGFSTLWNDVVSQLLFITLHRDDVYANVQGLRQSQDVHVITLHCHNLHFLNEENKDLIKPGNCVSWNYSLSFKKTW